MQRNKNSQNNFEKGEQSWRKHTFQFLVFYKAPVIGIKITCYWQKDVDQWNRRDFGNRPDAIAD